MDIPLREGYISTRYFDDRPPEDTRLIVGREDISAMVDAHAQASSSNLMFYAPRGYGKTTMMYWTREAFKKYNRNLLVFVSDGSKKIRVVEDYYGLVSTALCKWILNRKDKFEQRAVEYAKIMKREIKKLYKGNAPMWVFSEIHNNLLNFIENANENLPFYVFIDDFDILAIKNTGWELRDFIKPYISNEQRIRFVISMGAGSYIRLSKIDGAVVDRFDKFSLRPLNTDEIKEMIRRRLEVSRIDYKGSDEWYPFTEGAVELIADESQGEPRRALMLTREAILGAFGKGLFLMGERITEDFLSELLKKKGLDTATIILEEVGGEKAVKFVEAIKKEGGCARMKDICSRLGISTSHASYWLKKLVGEDIIEKKKVNGKILYCVVEGY